MSLNLENAVSAYYANLSNQATYFNFYSGVSLGLLAFLGGNSELQKLTKFVVIVGYTLFALVNGYIIRDIQRNLLLISDDLASCDSSCQSFTGTLGTMRARPLVQVVCFLVFAYFAFLIAMCLVAFVD